MSQVKSRSYTLRKTNGTWLGQIVLTSDGMYASVTDYGNFSYAWRSTGDEDFRKFLCSLNVHYFAVKMYQGITYICYGRKFEAAAKRYAEQILPALQEVLEAELEAEIEF